jgi:hypothetical protein
MTAVLVLVGVLVVMMALVMYFLWQQSVELRAPRPPDPSLQLLQQEVDCRIRWRAW